MTPRLSLIVVCHNMRRQVGNTLRSLGAQYQRGVVESDYEVIVIENRSVDMLDAAEIASLPGNFRYLLREEDSPSPAAAINDGFRLCRGDFIGLMIDGAYLLTPGVLHYALMAARITSEAFVALPTYHLGPDDQGSSVRQGYDLARQEQLLESIAWPADGYRLFEIGSFCGACPKGFFASILETNCYFASRAAFEQIGYADESFRQPGGGSLNLDITLRLGTRPGSVYFMLGGEGVFHQYHGGITTGARREEFVSAFNEELQRRWEGRFHSLARNPIVLGSFSEQAHRFLQLASAHMQRRLKNCRKNGWPAWEDRLPHDV